MKEKIFKALKDAILIGGKTSVSDATINLYVDMIDSEKITEESQIADAIKSYVRLLQATQANINNVAKGAAESKESEMKTAHEKAIEELKKSNPNPQDPPKEVPEWQEAIAGLTKTVETLTSVVQTQQGVRTHETLSEQLKTALSEKKVPEWYTTDLMEGRTLKDENDMNAWAEKITGKWGVREQELANSGFKNTVPPTGGNSETKESEEFANLIGKGTEKIKEQQKTN